MERSAVQPGATANAGRAAAPAAAGGGLMSRPGLLGGLAAGFLGAGLLGMLMGHGLAGGMGGLASVFGLLLQIVLFGGIAYFLWTWWQRRQQGQQAAAYSAPGVNRSLTNYDAPQGEPAPQNGPMQRLGLGGLQGGGMQGGGTQGASFLHAKEPSDAVGITPADYEAFETVLKDVQAAYGREDLHALRGVATPEMVSYFSEDLSENASRGVIDQVGTPKLLQGDLAEAWREGNAEYATVAMRYELSEAKVDRASGRVVEGDPSRPTEVTELWTFMRSAGGKWILSAIQQA
jgi:predicted lipid-binding transport protein (Tim44 family)